MATLNDVLKDVLEKDFDKEDVEKVVNPRDDEPTGTDREAQEGDTENEDVGQTYNGPGDYAQNSIGRSAVESFIKNSVYEKYGIDAKEMRTYSKMTPILHHPHKIGALKIRPRLAVVTVTADQVELSFAADIV